MIGKKKKNTLCYQSRQDGTDWAGAALVIHPLKKKQEQKQKKPSRLNSYAALNRLSQIGVTMNPYLYLKKSTKKQGSPLTM